VELNDRSTRTLLIILGCAVAISGLSLVPGSLASVPDNICSTHIGGATVDPDRRAAAVREKYALRMSLANAGRDIAILTGLVSLVALLVVPAGARWWVALISLASIALFGWYLYVDFHIAPWCA
jgi:hypothetical protein